MKNTCLKRHQLQATYKIKDLKQQLQAMYVTYCEKCRKHTENIDPKMFRTKNKRLIMQSKRPVRGIKKGIKTPMSKISLLNILF